MEDTRHQPDLEPEPEPEPVCSASGASGVVPTPRRMTLKEMKLEVSRVFLVCMLASNGLNSRQSATAATKARCPHLEVA